MFILSAPPLTPLVSSTGAQTGQGMVTLTWRQFEVWGLREGPEAPGASPLHPQHLSPQPGALQFEQARGGRGLL